ncbi:hypothetical protein I5M27_07205 [Adhaeribacter sp. BT258]|uniref:Uncharacterized protein n=1 Tax=Adhaeribacter terrigena TaxID=2793070 RepID=A0ABS1C297_9BACT|nr:hypothetical protein [Adhaeribacter terrigena]MBK0402768.1 hypothetical protein [Adhaeribacter terrigena]
MGDNIKNQEGKSQSQQDNTGKGFGVSGQNPAQNEGPVAGSAANTRGENVPSREGSSGGAKQGKIDPNMKSPQGSKSNPADTRGSDSSDKEFRNNQPNASTQQDQKNNQRPRPDQD